MLRIGSRDALTVRSVAVPFGSGLHLLYASDLHLTRSTPHIVEQLHAVCQTHMPDVVLLGGDLVDAPNGLPLLDQLIAAQTAPVYAVAGNHDVWVGLERVRTCVQAAGGSWLDGRVLLHPRLSLDGALQHEQTQNALLCTHDPCIFPAAVQAGYGLVLAGHLHGGQWVGWQSAGRLYPAAWFYRWNGDVFLDGQTTMIVSKGVHDTLPVRWNCPREVILCCC